MTSKTTFALSLFTVILFSLVMLVLPFLKKVNPQTKQNDIEYSTEIQRTGIGESNLRVPGVRGGLRVQGDLVMSSSFKLHSIYPLEMHQYIDNDKDVLEKNYYRLWQLKTPYWLEKNAFSDTVYIYCGHDTLFILISEISGK